MNRKYCLRRIKTVWFFFHYSLSIDIMISTSTFSLCAVVLFILYFYFNRKFSLICYQKSWNLGIFQSESWVYRNQSIGDNEMHETVDHTLTIQWGIPKRESKTPFVFVSSIAIFNLCYNKCRFKLYALDGGKSIGINKIQWNEQYKYVLVFHLNKNPHKWFISLAINTGDGRQFRKKILKYCKERFGEFSEGYKLLEYLYHSFCG